MVLCGFFLGFFSTLQRPVNAHFEAVSGLQFCWQAQDFQALFIGKGAKVLVYAVFRACGNFRSLWPQTFRSPMVGRRAGWRRTPWSWPWSGTGEPTWLQRRPRGKKPRTGPAERRAYDYQSIHAQTIITFVFRKHTITRASMPKP